MYDSIYILHPQVSRQFINFKYIFTVIEYGKNKLYAFQLSGKFPWNIFEERKKKLLCSLHRWSRSLTTYTFMQIRLNIHYVCESWIFFSFKKIHVPFCGRSVNIIFFFFFSRFILWHGSFNDKAPPQIAFGRNNSKFTSSYRIVDMVE